MLINTPRPQKYPLQLIDIYWKEGEDCHYLATLSAPLWKHVERLAKEVKLQARSQFPELLQRGGKLLALQALSKRNRARRWISEHLVESGIPLEMAWAISGQMAMSGYANDRTLQGRILAEAERRGRGAYWVQLEMKKQRLDEEMIKASAQIRQELEVDAISIWLQRQNLDQQRSLPPAQRAKIFQKLLRRGYKVTSVETALARLKD